MEKTKLEELAALLEKTGHAHHKAFILTNGRDPEWAIWYAKYLKKPLCKLLNRKLTRSRIIYELVRLEEFADISSRPWPVVYAEDLLEKYQEEI